MLHVLMYTMRWGSAEWLWWYRRWMRDDEWKIIYMIGNFVWKNSGFSFGCVHSEHCQLVDRALRRIFLRDIMYVPKKNVCYIDDHDICNIYGWVQVNRGLLWCYDILLWHLSNCVYRSCFFRRELGIYNTFNVCSSEYKNMKIVFL